jgi:hypothetical protein
LLLRQVRRHIAVDEANRDYLVIQAAVHPECVHIVHNAIDLGRIQCRSRPLPERPERALIFTKTKGQVPVLQEACRRSGITVDTLGRGVDRVFLDPEQELVKYDLIFATARSAMEAIASGVPTIVVDARGLAGMATRENLARLRMHNFGIRSLVHPVTVERVLAEIGLYSPTDAAQVTEELRVTANIDAQIDAFEAIYAAVLAESASLVFSEQELLEQLVPLLRKWLPRFPGVTWAWQFEKAELLNRIAELDAVLSQERAELLNRITELEAVLSHEREEVQRSVFIQLRNTLRKLPWLNRALVAILTRIRRQRKQ